MKAAASRMSSSSFGDWGCIDCLARLVYRVNKVGVFQRADHHQVDLAAKQPFAIIVQAEVAVKETVVAAGVEIDQKVEIARLRIEGSSGRGAEQLQLAHAVAAAQGGNFRELWVNDGRHGGLRGNYATNTLLMATRTHGSSACIDGLALGQDALAEVGVGQAAPGDEVHRPAEQRFQPALQRKVGLRVGGGRHVVEFDQEIQIA